MNSTSNSAFSGGRGLSPQRSGAKPTRSSQPNNFLGAPQGSSYLSSGGKPPGGGSTTNKAAAGSSTPAATSSNNNTQSLVTLHLNQQPGHQSQIAGSSQTPQNHIHQSLGSNPHSKNVSSTNLPHAAFANNNNNTPSLKYNNNPGLVGQQQQPGNLTTKPSQQLLVNRDSVAGDVSSKSNFTKALLGVSAHSGTSSHNVADFDSSSSVKASNNKVSLGSGSKKSSFMKNPMLNKEERRSTPAASSQMGERESESRKSKTEINKKEPKIPSPLPVVNILQQQGVKFKTFFDSIISTQVANSAPLSTGGEYYFNDSASNQLADQSMRTDFIFEEEEIKQTVCDLENQRVVRADAERTRGSESLDKDLIELVLTRYCKNNQLKYKQGLNEVVAPFMYLMQKGGSKTLDLRFVYNCFSGFVHRYLTNFYEEEEFYSLQTALAFLSLLHRYHDPQVSFLMLTNQVTPEMYAVPWFLTYFANKFDISVLIEFWDLIISDDDKLNIFFFSIAILIHNRQAILESDPSHLPSVLARITIQSSAELKQVWKITQQVRSNTPYSFGELPDVKRIFTQQPLSTNVSEGISRHQKSLGNEYDECDDLSNNSETSKENLMAALERIENIPCLPILPEEIFFYSYPETVNCSNPACSNSLSQFKYREVYENNAYLLSQPSQQPQKQEQHMLLNHQGKRRSQGIDDALSPIRQQLVQQNNPQHQQRRMTDYKNMMKNNKKANIHDIIKREIHSKQNQQQYYQQQLHINNHAARLMSNQPSPTKGLSEQYENYKGIDLSSQRSPFKQMNKQLQAQADGMPLETESNVNDDAQEQQESHIDLINETARMKHLAMNQELRNQQMNQYGECYEMSPKLNGQIIGGGRYIESPTTLNRNVAMMGGTHQHFNQNQLQQQQVYYEKGFSRSTHKNNTHNISSQLSNHSNSSSKRGSISALPTQNNQATLPMHPLTQSVPSHKLDLCAKCVKKHTYEEKQQHKNAGQQSKQLSPNLNDTQLQEEESHDFYYEKIRFLIVDCRIETLQKEALLPNSFQLSIPSECTKEYLQQQTDKVGSCKDIYHICLMGLDPLTEKISQHHKFETNKQGGGDKTPGSDNLLDIGAYHESILRFFIEDFQKKGFKYISVVPGGFSECHEIAMRYNFSLVNHDLLNCYHCDKTKDNKQSQSDVYNQQFNLIGFTDLVTGFKRWYDVANTKIKSFVKGTHNATPPIKVLGVAPQPPQQHYSQMSSQSYRNHHKSGNNVGGGTFDNVIMTGHSNQGGMSSLGIPAKLSQQTLQETYQSNSSESLHLNATVKQGNNHQPSLNHKHYQKDPYINKKRGVLENSEEGGLMQFDQHHNQFQHLSKQGNNGDVNLDSLPLSFISQSSRQDTHNRFQGSHCSSNASVNSSQNDGGNNLRDAISNKKIMSYKLMSKVPGDRSSEIMMISQGNLISHQTEPRAGTEVQLNTEENDMIVQKEGGLNYQGTTKSDNVMSVGGASSTTQLAIQSQYSLQQSDIDQQLSDIKILLSPTEKIQVEEQKVKTTKKIVVEAPSIDVSNKKAKPKEGELVKKESKQPQDYTPSKQQEKDPLVEEDLYYINGITKQFEVMFSEIETVMKKSANIVYRCMKLHLKKKPESGENPSSKVSSSSSTPSFAYPVYLIITQFTVAVVREVGRKRTNLLGPVNQSIESSMSQTDEWDQNDFDELHPSLAGGQESSKSAGNAPSQKQQALIESRFLMFDLIKITSRKSSSKIITFYFRIPLLEEYNTEVLETNIVSQLDQKPSIKYQFAFKRKNYKEVSASFEFSKEEDAKQCIANVSTLYKKLKSSKP